MITVTFANKFLLCFLIALLQDRFIPNQSNFLQQMKAGKTAMAFGPKPEQLKQVWCNALFTGGWIWLLSLHSQWSLYIPAHCIPLLHWSMHYCLVIPPKASGWTPWAQEVETLCFFPTSPSSTESVNFFMQQKIQILLLAQSFACTQRRTNSTICCSAERIRLC